MIERLYRLDLHLQGPLLSQAAGTLAFGLDAAMQRYREEPVLNGPQIRGNLRHVLLRFKRTTDAFRPYFSDWFPNEPELGTTWRSTLDFDLFWRPNCVPDKDGTRTRIKIDSATGKVEKGALQVLEDPFPSGSSVTFSGNIHARFADEKERACFEKWIDKALQWLDAIGSQKGVGYGRLMGHKLATISKVPSPAIYPQTPARQQRVIRHLSGSNRHSCTTGQCSLATALGAPEVGPFFFPGSRLWRRAAVPSHRAASVVSTLFFA